MKKILLFTLFSFIAIQAEELLTDSQKMMQERQKLYNTENIATQTKEQKQLKKQYKYQYKKGEGSKMGSRNMYKGSYTGEVRH